MTADGAKPVAGAGAVRRALHVLRVVGRSQNGLTVAALAEALDLTKPTAHRLAGALIDEGFLRASGSPQTLRLGSVFLELAHSAWNDLDLRSAADTELAALVAATGLSARLLIRSGEQMVCIEALHPGERVRALDVGGTEPLHGSASGRAVLAFSSDAFVRDATENAVTRARFYAIDDASGPWRSVAAPIFDERRQPVAALAVSGSAAHLETDGLHQLAPQVLEAARRTSRAAGGYPFAISPAGDPEGPDSGGVEVLATSRDLIGDSPVWDAAHDALFWIDILGPALNRRARDGSVLRVAMPDVIGALLLTPDHRLLAAFTDSIAIIDPLTGEVGYRSFVEGIHEGCRFNDGGHDPQGRLWLGSVDPSVKGASARLLRIDGDGRITTTLDGLTLPNGFVWSKDGRSVFLVDSAAHEIRRYDYDIAEGQFGAHEVVHRFQAEARPAGLAWSPQGTLWTALWDGWSLVELSTVGEILDRLVVPVPRPSGLAWIDRGAGAPELVFTSARVRLSPTMLDRAPLSGSLFIRTSARPQLPWREMAKTSNNLPST